MSTLPPAPHPRPLAQHQAEFYLELGRGLATEKATWEQTVAALRRAEDIAPQFVRANPYVREVVADLRRRAGRDAVGRELRGMAYRMGLSV